MNNARKSPTWPPPALPVCPCFIVEKGFVQSVISLSGISSSVVFRSVVFVFHAQCAGSSWGSLSSPSPSPSYHSPQNTPSLLLLRPSSASSVSFTSPLTPGRGPGAHLERLPVFPPYHLLLSSMVCCRSSPSFHRRVAALVVTR